MGCGLILSSPVISIGDILSLCPPDVARHVMQRMVNPRVLTELKGTL
jgi:hypothetical protein